MKLRLAIKTATGCVSVATALAEPVAVFECREITGRDWPRTLVTYELRTARGNAETGQADPPSNATLPG